MSLLDTDIWDRDDIEETSEYEEFSEDQADELDDDDVEEWAEIVYENEKDEDEADFGTSVVESARIRLEQGRLYEMLIKHDLFDGVDAIPEAVAKVQKELKDYIVERLEILLGMRAETQKAQTQQIITPPQFNDVEVQALKMIAAQVTKGASKNAPTTQASVVEQAPEPKLNSVKERPKSLNKIQAAPEKKIAPVQQAPQKKVAQPVQQKKLAPQAPQKKTVTSKPVPKAVLEKQASSVDESAKKDLQYIEKLKTMSLEEANKVVAARHKRPIPPPTNISQDTINSHYQGKMAINQTAQTFAALLANAKKV